MQSRRVSRHRRFSAFTTPTFFLLLLFRTFCLVVARDGKNIPAQRHRYSPSVSSRNTALAHSKSPIAVWKESQGLSCTLGNIRYVSSDLEHQWMDLAPNIHSRENYCQRVTLFRRPFSQWLERAQDTTMVSAQQLVPNNHVPRDAVFSRFEYTWTCGGVKKVFISAIEPLAGALRHPDGWCSYPAELQYEFLLPDVFDSPGDKSGTKFLFDIGARTYDVGVGLSPNGAPLSAQKYLTETYASRGLAFDRILLWEAKPENASSIWENVPQHLLPSYQYFNRPATAADNMTNPLRVLKHLVTPEDFVVLKLDIDDVDLEQSLLSQIVSDASLLRLVDELYYEWNPVDESSWDTMQNAYKMFHALRSAGVRAHGWI